MIEGLGKRLQGLRIKKGLTQREAAAISDIECDPSVLATYERDVRAPKLETLVRFARFYGVSTDYLLGLSEYETPEQIATSAGIPLTNEALNYLKTCDKKRLVTLSLILSAPSSDDFLDTLRGYIEEFDIRDEDGQIGAEYHTIRESLGRHLSDDQFVAFVEYWAWDSFKKVTEQLAREIRETCDLEDAGPKRGRPRKYKTHKKNAPPKGEA
jgi:transcriptional regulator with XRE-family HTH domain